MGTYADEIRKAREQEAKAAEERAKAYSGALSDYGNRQVSDIESANQAYQNSLNDAQKQYRERMDAGYTQFADIINNNENRIKEAEAQAKAEEAGARKAAGWTGAGELAASVINMIGVGSFNSANQQYKNYSQDWMQKADNDMRMNRARIDNMRDRQRAAQEHMIQMRMGDAGRDAQMANQLAEARRKGDIDASNARYKAQVDPLTLQYKAESEADAIRSKGAAEAANAGLHEASLAEQRRARQESAAMQAARYGLKRNADGSYSIDMASPITQASSRASSGSGGSRNTLYYYNETGSLVPVQMTTKEYDEFVNQSYSVLKDDPDFVKAYRRATTDTERKSIIYQFAIQNDERRAVLSQYGSAPESYRREDKPAESKDENVSGYGRVSNNNDKTGLSSYK